MKPRFYNHLAAYFLPIVTQGSGIAAVACASIVAAPGLDQNLGWSLKLAFAGAILASYALGALLGLVFLGRLLGWHMVILQGGPFQVGDHVLILRGNRTNKVAEVYEVWESRSQVRLRLSEDEAKTVADVFPMHELMKVRDSAELEKSTVTKAS